ncbi:hypothetical protein, partial [Zavarzinella formosa]|uniref:hypothetical protein n=1 Tax=Zavarzinella formosa TaxID=360055 RepID=UPI0005934950
MRNLQIECRIQDTLCRHAEGVVTSSLAAWQLAAPDQPCQIQIASQLRLYRRAAGRAIPPGLLACRVRRDEDQVLARLADTDRPAIKGAEVLGLSAHTAVFLVPGMLRVGLLEPAFQAVRLFLDRFAGQAGLLPLWSALA